MDEFRAELSTCCCGGIKCRCCRPVTPKGKKDQTWTQRCKRALKQRVADRVKQELYNDTTEPPG